MADFESSFTLEDALTDNPPEIEAEIKRDFISSLEAEPYDDVVGETCGKADYVPLLDDDAAKCGNKPKADGAERAASSQPPVVENGDRGMEEHFGKVSLGGAVDEKMYSEFVAQKEPWQVEQEHGFEAQPLFQPIKQPDPFEANRGDDLLSDQILLPSWDMKSRPAFTEQFGAAGDLPGLMAVPKTNFFSDPSSDTLVLGTAAVLSPRSPKSPTAPPNNAAYEDDWLQVDHRHAEETEDLAEISEKTAGTPGAVASERSPWEAASFPMETVDENARSHWQPTILEQQKLGMHHEAEPSRPAEFTLLEASATAGTSAELAGVAEFADWQHAQPPVIEVAETQDNKDPLFEFITFDEAVPEEEGVVEKLCFPPKNSPEESEVETDEYDAAAAPGGPGDAMEGLSSQQDVNTPHTVYEVISEPTELLEDLESRPESFPCDAVAVPVTSEAAEEESLPPQSSNNENIPNVVVCDGTTLPVGTDESLLQQNFYTESHSEILEFETVAVGAELAEELQHQESEHPKEHHAAPLKSMALAECTENVLESLPCAASSSPVTHEAAENESVSQQNLITERLVFEAVAVGAEIAEERSSHKPPEESTEILESSESVPESFAYNEVSVPLTNGKSENGSSSEKDDSNEEALGFGAVSQETAEECLLENRAECRRETLEAHYIVTERFVDQEHWAESGSPVADLSRREASEEECLVTQSSSQESIPKDLACDALNLPLETEEASVALQDTKEESFPKSLEFDDDLLRVERVDKALPSADHQQEHHAGEPSASTLVQDVGGHPVETPAANLFSFQLDTQEAHPYLGQPLDPPIAPAGDVFMELKFEETRAPADGACAVEVEKHLADAGGHPEPLHAPAGEIFEELKANISEAPAPAVISPFEGQKPQVEAGEVHRPEDFILDASVISQASPSIEAIAGSITTAPSKDLPPSPDKKLKASASAKPTAATKGRSTSASSPKQSTPPPGKKAASPAPVASSTPKRPTSSSARTSSLTPKDSNTPRSSTLSPKEMKPKALDLKSPVKSPEKKTPLSKPATTPTARPTSKTPVGTPKAAMVPALAVAASKSTTPTPPRRPTTIKTEAKPVEAKKTQTNAKSADPSRPRTAPANSGKSNATTPSSPGTNSAPGAPLNRPKPSKPPGTKPIPESNATGEKKLPAARAPVSKTNVVPKATRPATVAAPDLKNVRSKIGSTDNLKHQPGGGRANLEKKPVPVGLPRKPAAPLPVTKTATTKTTVSKETAQKDTNGKVHIVSKKVNYSHVQSKCGSKDNIKHVPGGGNVPKSVPASKMQPANAPKPRPGSTNVQIMNKKVDTSKVSSKCGSKANIKHKPGGGDVKIESHKNIPKDKVQAKVGSLDNMGHVPAGGNVKSEGSEEAGDLAQTPQNGDLSTPQSLAGSETQQNGEPTEGSDQRETQNLDNQIQETN